MRAPLARAAVLGFTLLLTLTTGRAAAAAEGPTLTLDVNTNPADSSVEGLVDVDGVAWFFACDGSHSRALWRSDGTAEGTTKVQDVEPCDFRGSGPEHVGSRLVFTAGTDGEQVWVSSDDGDPVMLGAFEYPDSFTDLGGTLTFAAGRLLLKSDGTPEGTTIVKKLPSGIWESVAMGGAVFLVVNEQDLWTSDGSKAGTTLVKDLGEDAALTDLASVGDRLFFRVRFPGRGTELWKSDGTSTGTKRVKDILPGASDAVGAFVATADETLYFSAKGAGGTELWKSNGTSAGTRLVADILPGAGSAKPRDLVPAGDGVYFSADDGVNGRGLYHSDGTEVGTVRLKDRGPVRSRFPDPTDLAAVSDALFFSAKGPDDVELWTSDGTAEGTTQVKDIDPSGSAAPQDLAGVGGKLYFSATDPEHGRELWTSDGTADGTAMVADLNTATAGSSARDLGRAGNRLLFGASTELDCVAEIMAGKSCEDDEAGYGPWASHSTKGATILGDMAYGSGGFVTIGSNAYFAADDGVRGLELWKTDGTAAGTSLVKDIEPGVDSSSPGGLTAVGDHLYFLVSDFEADEFGHGRGQLWTTDGTPTGTHRVPGFPSVRRNANVTESMRDLTNVGGTLVVIVNTGGCGGPCDMVQRLWTTDGTKAGTTTVKPAAGLPIEIADLTAVGGTLFFTGGDASGYGSQLWKSDLTSAGTKLVKDLGDTDLGLVNLTAVGDRLFFSAGRSDFDTGAYTDELWTSNGTKAGTKRLAQFVGDTSGVAWLTNVNGTLFFTANVAPDIPALFTSDGTAAGTRSVAEFFAGNEAGPRDLVAFGDTVYFSADEGSYGRELWRSSGAVGGTDLVAHINENGSSNPHSFVKIGNRLFFVADDGIHGQEVWRYVP